MRLRNLLRSVYSNFAGNYKATWSTVLNGVEPDPDSVPDNLSVSTTVPLIPRSHDFSQPVGTNQFHTMRALDRVRPENVRVVILGQDPYPRRRQATGRAFEQGDFESWNDPVAYGIRHIIQRLAQHRSGENSYARNDDGWNDVRDDASSLGMPLGSRPFKQLYDNWEDQGVIFLNMVLTYTLPIHVFNGHAKFWRPVVIAILRHLATRSSKRVVFALWGRKPGDFFSGASILQAAQNAGTLENCRVVRKSHPSARPQGGNAAPFLRGPNPFQQINRELQNLGESLIDW